MACAIECTQFDMAMELLIDRGFEGIADCVSILMNLAMQLERSCHLNADLCERTGQRTNYANWYKSMTMHTRAGEVKVAILQTPGTDFYSRSLE